MPNYLDEFSVAPDSDYDRLMRDTIAQQTSSFQTLSYSVSVHSTPPETYRFEEKTREQIYDDFRLALREVGANAPDFYEPYKPLPTLAEVGAYLERKANPTPADRAAEKLNRLFGTHREPDYISRTYFGGYFGTPEWFEVQRSIDRVRRDARPYAYEITRYAFSDASVIDLQALADAGYTYVNHDEGTVTLRHPGTVRAFYTTATIKP